MRKFFFILFSRNRIVFLVTFAVYLNGMNGFSFGLVEENEHNINKDDSNQ